MYKLLIADDEYEIRNGVIKYFPWEKVGFEVVGEAENGRQALEYIRNNVVDAVLCDVMMPVMSGIDLAEWLYKEKSPIKVVFFSGHGTFEYAQKALTYGVRHYVLKSSKSSELMDLFAKLKLELDEQVCVNKSQYRYVNEYKHECSYNERIINLIKEFVQVNYKDITLEKAAEHVHMNPYYISRLFKQKTRQNFSDYVIEIRMQKASELLKDITYKIYEISYMVGYSNSKNFNRTFKKYYGMNPKEYRNHLSGMHVMP